MKILDHIQALIDGTAEIIPGKSSITISKETLTKVLKIARLASSAADALNKIDAYEELRNAIYDELEDLNNGPFTIHVPPKPKKKVKSERWFAVQSWDSEWAKDNIAWYIFYTKEEAQERYPNALAYVKAEVEVEIDE